MKLLKKKATLKIKNILLPKQLKKRLNKFVDHLEAHFHNILKILQNAILAKLLKVLTSMSISIGSDRPVRLFKSIGVAGISKPKKIILKW